MLYLNLTLRRVCDDTDSVLITKYLFGDNLAAAMKDVKELERIGCQSVNGQTK